MKDFAALTHVGKIRGHNEDCHLADPELGLWLVADGVGGHSHGEVAAQIVSDTIRAELAAGSTLQDAVTQAHRGILDEIRTRNCESNMGSTVVALQLHEDNTYEIVWVGDSRAYVFDGRLRQLTRDHNPVSELVASGAISAKQAASHPERHVLSQSLGVSETTVLKPGLVAGSLLPKQQILLCSDGLTDELPNDMICKTLGGQATTGAQADALLAAALEAGGRDNISVVLVGEAMALKAQSNTDLETTQNMGEHLARARRGLSGKPIRFGIIIGLVTALVVFVLW